MRFVISLYDIWYLIRYSYGLDGRSSIPDRDKSMSNVKTGSGTHLATYPTGSGGSFHGGGG
jgi:hypothetical protein